MEKANKYRALFWVLFFLSALGMALLIIYAPQWVWTSFPFVGTFLIKAMDAI